MPYIIQSMLILLGPAFYAASIYMLLGRLICFLEAQHHSMIRTQWLTKLFLMGDILSIIAQGGGSWDFILPLPKLYNTQPCPHHCMSTDVTTS